jgi:hypothetical protein
MKTGETVDLDRIITLRKSGLAEQALPGIVDLLGKQAQESVNAEVLIEALKLMLLCGSVENAHKIYQLLRQLPKATTRWEYEFLARLQIASATRIPELSLPRVTPDTLWATGYRDRGTDERYQTRLTDCVVRCPTESALFNFTVACPSCNCSHHQTVLMTLLIDREFLCPNCLARLSLDYDSIRGFLRNRFSKSTTARALAMSGRLHATRHAVANEALSAEHYPLVVRSLGHDYVVFLNQLASQQLSGAQERTLS